MVFRKAVENDLDSIYGLIKQAREYFRQNGIDQWQDNYPNPDIVMEDIKNEECYVVENDDGIIATVVLSFRGEKSYDKIYEGKWLSDNDYAVIHRIAVDSRHKGKRISSFIVSRLEDMCLEKNVFSIRVDTHRDNKSMLKMLSNNGYTYCGIIYLETGSERLAFEKILK
ncbi:MAG TPA: GNAT family N-acetyltransferase [Clostridiaceae bacterium]|nr:GNAT family N-acetyltransferase [Clostridiaceae bacterium]